MIGSGHKTDKVFAHYANHIKKESALETIAKTSERLFAPIFEELSITDIEYCIYDEAAAGNNGKLISFNRREAWEIKEQEELWLQKEVIEFLRYASSTFFTAKRYEKLRAKAIKDGIRRKYKKTDVLAFVEYLQKSV